MGAMINEDRFGVVQVTFDPAALGAGVKPGDLVFAVKPTLTATMFSAQARVSAANTVELTLVATAGTPNAGSETWTFFWFRPERVTTVVNA
jgi:hypothetical protein